MSPIDKAIRLIGGKTATARVCGVSRQTVHAWVVDNRIPAEHAPSLEAATKGMVTRSELRPDLWPTEGKVA